MTKIAKTSIGVGSPPGEQHSLSPTTDALHSHTVWEYHPLRCHDEMFYIETFYPEETLYLMEAFLAGLGATCVLFALSCLPAGWRCGGTVRRNQMRDTCRTNCRKPFCGDKIKDTGEQCDDGKSGSKTYTKECKFTSRCKFTKAITGSIAGHNLGSHRDAQNLEECQALCEKEPRCMSVDFNQDDPGSDACCLGDCQIGHGCSNDNDGDYVYSDCITD